MCKQSRYLTVSYYLSYLSNGNALNTGLPVKMPVYAPPGGTAWDADPFFLLAVIHEVIPLTKYKVKVKGGSGTQSSSTHIPPVEVAVRCCYLGISRSSGISQTSSGDSWCRNGRGTECYSIPPSIPYPTGIIPGRPPIILSQHHFLFAWLHALTIAEHLGSPYRNL